MNVVVLLAFFFTIENLFETSEEFTRRNNKVSLFRKLRRFFALVIAIVFFLFGACVFFKSIGKSTKHFPLNIPALENGVQYFKHLRMFN